MTIHLLYDNQAVRPHIASGWGFSCLIDGRILFDTGEAGPELLNNLKEMEVSLDEIEALVLSHPHWDHTGGVKALREALPDIPIYLPEGAMENYPDKQDLDNSRLIYCAEPLEIGPVRTTGTFTCTFKGNNMPEHGLVVKSPRGVSLITGCAHPGIKLMAQTVADDYRGEELYTLFGGFHLVDQTEDQVSEIFETLKSMGYARIIGTHCSGEYGRSMSDYATGAGDIFSL